MIKKLVRLLERESGYTPEWVVPAWDDEKAEFKRTVKELSLDPRLLKGAFGGGKLVRLRQVDWQQLDNTDSWGINLRDARRLAKEFGRNIEKILKGFKDGRKMPAPIVLFREGERPYLIGGNTRLMAAHAVGINPKVFAVRMD